MKKIFIIGLVIVVGIILGSWINKGQYSSDMSNLTGQPSSEDNNFSKLKVGELVLNIEVVSDQLSLSKGLSGREEIGSDGMLFILPSEQRTAFWMKDMKFDIDIIWIRDGKVVEITEDIPTPDDESSKLILYSPSQPVDRVLEVNSGDSLRLGIKVGDEVTQLE
jgi:hypothetical protein